MRRRRGWICGACSGSSPRPPGLRGGTGGPTRSPRSSVASPCASARSKISRTPCGRIWPGCWARPRPRRSWCCARRSRPWPGVWSRCPSRGPCFAATWRSSRSGKGSTTWTATSARTTASTRRRRAGTRTAGSPSPVTRISTSTMRAGACCFSSRGRSMIRSAAPSPRWWGRFARSTGRAPLRWSLIAWAFPRMPFASSRPRASASTPT